MVGRLPIVVCVDGETTLHQQINGVSWVFFASQAGNLMHYVRALELASKTFERTLCLEEDMIVSTDVAEVLGQINTDATFVCIGGGDNATGTPLGQTEHSYCPIGNIICRKDIERIVEYAQKRAWIGKSRPNHSSFALPAWWIGHDAVFHRFVLDCDATTEYADECYVGHIGVRGMDNDDPENIEAEMFCGKPSTWLNNAIELFASKRHKAFCPSSFIYR